VSDRVLPLPARTGWRVPRRLLVSLGVAALAALWAAGSVHVLTGSESRTKILSKARFGFAETWIDMDELGRLSAAEARTRYPLTMHAFTLQAIASGTEPDLGPGSVARLRPGMSAGQVQELFGLPAERRATDPDAERWTYRSVLQGRRVSLDFAEGRLRRVDAPR
jgi:hypothetical protein